MQAFKDTEVILAIDAMRNVRHWRAFVEALRRLKVEETKRAIYATDGTADVSRGRAQLVGELIDLIDSNDATVSKMPPEKRYPVPQ